MKVVFADSFYYFALLSPTSNFHKEAGEFTDGFAGTVVTTAWTLTDCMSFVVMKQENISDALTADHHFEHAGFNILFKSK